MTLDDALVISKVGSAVHQITGQKSFFRWKAGEELPVLDTTYDQEFLAFVGTDIRLDKMIKSKRIIEDEEILSVLKTSFEWEPDLPKNLAPLERLSLCAPEKEEA